MESIVSELAELRARFDALRPVGSEAPTDLQRKYDIEQTYASNAIEGNTLSLGETAGLRATISAELKRVFQRPELIERLGPDRPA